MPEPDAVPRFTVARARLASAVSFGLPPEVITERRRDLAASKIARDVERALAVAPPLSDRQVEALAAMLRGEQ